MRIPWRLRIASAVLRGFFKDPLQALRSVRNINTEMASVYRFKLHIHGKDFLRDLMEESSKLGMRPFLMWGTLLGFIREGGFLTHDYDIDLGVLLEDYGKKNDLIRAMTARGYRVRHDVPFSLSFETRDRLLHLDIDLLYPFQGDLISSMPSERTGRITAQRFPKDAFETLERKVFPGNFSVWVPVRAEKVLETIYGVWRTPARSYNYENGPRNQISDPESKGIGRSLPNVF